MTQYEQGESESEIKEFGKFKALLDNLPDSDSSQTAETYLNLPFSFEQPEQLSPKQEKEYIKALLAFLSIPRTVARKLLKLSKKNKKDLLFLLKVCVFYWCFYSTMIWVHQIFLPFLRDLLIAIQEKIAQERTKWKQRLNNPEQIEESKGFWDKHLASLSQILKINRGGSFVPIREANIYEFSALDQQQALLSISPIPAYILFERSKLELENFILESSLSPIGQKRFSLNMLKEFPSKLRKCFSKLKKLIPLGEILIGISLLLVINNGMVHLPQTPNVQNTPIMVSSPVNVRVVRPILEFQSSETRVKDPEMIESSRTETKDPVKTPSRLISGNRARKRAKIVQLSDLPPLSEQDFDREIDSIAIPRQTPIRIRLN